MGEAQSDLQGGPQTRVLVVEDDPRTCAVLSSILERAGHELCSAPNGAVGLEAVMTFRPDVVVLDFFMPVADGRAFHQGLREVSRDRLGLVVISGTPEVGDWCARVGITEFLRKPFDAEDLVSAVGRALETARSRPSGATPASTPSSYRIRIERAVLLVGSNAMAKAIRGLLREGTRPMQVAVVESVEDARRALGSIAVDVVALCGEEHGLDPSFADLLVVTRKRSIPVVVRPHRAGGVPQVDDVHMCAFDNAEAMAARIAQLVVA